MKAYLDLVKQVMDGFCTVKVIQVKHRTDMPTLSPLCHCQLPRIFPDLSECNLSPSPALKWQEMRGLQESKSQ